VNLDRTFEEIRMHKQKDPDTFEYNCFVMTRAVLATVAIVLMIIIYRVLTTA